MDCVETILSSRRARPPAGDVEVERGWARLPDLAGLEQGAFVCDRRGTVLSMNATADALLDGSIDAERRLRFARETDGATFATLLGTALDHQRAGETSTMACQLAAPWSDAILRAMRLRGDGWSARSTVLVLIEKRRGVSAEALRRRFGLTAAEGRIAIALADGIGLDDFCAARGIARATVRSQLKSIFRKTETRGQVQLAVLVARLRWAD